MHHLEGQRIDKNGDDGYERMQKTPGSQRPAIKGLARRSGQVSPEVEKSSMWIACTINLYGSHVKDAGVLISVDSSTTNYRMFELIAVARECRSPRG